MVLRPTPKVEASGGPLPCNNERVGLALITGGSSGIGFELAKLFARDSHSLILVARCREKLAEAAEKLRAEGGSVRWLAADLSSREGCGEVQSILLGQAPDYLINNAGFGRVGHFARTDLELELRMIGLHVCSTTSLTKAILPAMLERGRGRIMNVASVAAFQPGPFTAVYYASKSYVVSFSQALSEELRGTGVTVTALCPGRTETEFAKSARLAPAGLLRYLTPMSAGSVAAAGYRAMMAGKRVVVPGAVNKIVAQAVRIAPGFLTLRMTRAIQQRG